jgi:outer membrane protein assembly factor BamB
LLCKSESLKDITSYISPILINHNDKKLIISATENYIFGVEPETGKILWTFDFGKYSEFLGDWKAAVNSNTPLYYKGELYITSGYNHKSVKLKLSQNADNVTIAWIDSTLDVHHGGVVRIGEYIYGANWLNNGMGSWVCLEWNSGKVMYEQKWENKGSIISADGMLYCYEEKRGNIALVEATPESFNIVSTFKIPLGKGPHWSHLVIDNGKLYVRHGTAIMVYNISNK